MEIFESFFDQQSFDSWYAKNLACTSSIEPTLSNIINNGINSKFFGHISPSLINVIGENYREHLLAHNLNSRQRAILECLVSESDFFNGRSPKIYAPEGITDLALRLRGKYPLFIGSEYMPSSAMKDALFPIPHEDLQALSFSNETFDAVVTCDVIEHIPNLFQCLNEIYRVLKPGGIMLSTHPFTWSARTTKKATISNGEITYFTEPEYHGNPLIPHEGSLVFNIPGWDILDVCNSIGFKKSEMVIIASETLGILSSSPPFINVLRTYK